MGSFLRSSSAAAGRARGHKVRKSCAPVRIPMLPNSAEADGRGGGSAAAGETVVAYAAAVAMWMANTKKGALNGRAGDANAAVRQSAHPPRVLFCLDALGRWERGGDREGDPSSTERERASFLVSVRAGIALYRPLPPHRSNISSWRCRVTDKAHPSYVMTPSPRRPTDRGVRTAHHCTHSLTRWLAGWLPSAKCQPA